MLPWLLLGLSYFYSFNVKIFKYVSLQAHDVNNAMEASRKSRVTFSAAKAAAGDAQSKDCLLGIKKALDFNFQDVEGLLGLVRLATEAISR